MIFDRHDTTADRPDAHLPMLTVTEATRLRQLVTNWFAERQSPMSLGGNQVRVSQDQYLPLDNLAHFARSTPPAEWAALVDRHFSAFFNAPYSATPADQLLRDTRLRLLADDALPDDGGFDYVRPVAEGLVEALALDLPDTVRMLHDDDVAAAGLDALRAAGRANLLAEPADHELVERPGGAVLHYVSGDSFFVASKVLVLDDYALATTGRPLPEDGALVVVPARSLMVYYPIADGHVVEAINDLANFGLGAYEDNAGSISPRLYWWHAGALTSLTRIDHATQEFSIQPPDALMTVLDRLVGG
ncbi:hypothetical protein [Yinghuangia seranimata]|uniref:hypothetical protein n=1 Tax=Yinghuangia seranimata TaxID=408067 RepID=UPI00248BD929|nr:hypothetical protein [Yinghuangia seranimata]MDI2131241.1 hypothetical protein [Yinghuangia seranimata]